MTFIVDEWLDSSRMNMYSIVWTLSLVFLWNGIEREMWRRRNSHSSLLLLCQSLVLTLSEFMMYHRQRDDSFWP